MDGLIYINGDYLGLTEAKIPILDAGFSLGLAVFDTMSVHQGYLFRVDAHLDRLFASLKTVRFDSLPQPKTELREIVLETIRRSGLRDATVQIMVTRGVREPGVPLREWKPTVIVQCLPQPKFVSDSRRAAGVRACVSTVRSLPAQCVPPQVKHTNRFINYFSMLEAHDRGVDEPIMIDGAGSITEGPNFNIFAVRKEQLFTPLEGVLRGITRDTIMQIARYHEYAVTERPMTAYDLYIADEVFVCSTNRGALGIVEIDGRTIGEGKPGPITSRLNQTYWSWRVDSPYALHVDSQPSGAVKESVSAGPRERDKSAN